MKEELLKVIESNLPKQVGETLQNRLKKLEKTEKDIEEG